LDRLTACRAEALCLLSILPQLCDDAPQRITVAGCHEATILPVASVAGQPWRIRDNRGPAGRHRFVDRGDASGVPNVRIFRDHDHASALIELPQLPVAEAFAQLDAVGKRDGSRCPVRPCTADLGVWRLEIHARLRRLRCPEHGVHVEGVPFARDGARFTRDLENLVAWLMTKTDRTATCRLVRVDWETVGRIIKRVGDELLPDRLNNLFEISLDEVAWRTGHRYLTLVGDHRQSCVVWGTEGKGLAAADEFFAELDPMPAEPAPAGRSSSERVPAIMVPFGPCPTVPAGEGIQGAWLEPGLEIEPAIFARASRLTAVSMDMTGGYAKSVRAHAPEAEIVIVIDNYHVYLALRA
jgi:hypothetical protein